MLNLLLALVLGAVAVGLFLYLLRLLLAAAGLPLSGGWDRRRLQQYIDRAQRADRMMQQGQIEPALSLLRESFCFTVFKDVDLARAQANHHTGVLSRLLSVTSETVRPLSLPKVDRLLRERRELQRTYIAARQSPGKGPRSRELWAKLAANRRELEPAIRQLIEEVRTATAGPTYH